MTEIHPTAIVHKSALIGEGSFIGPYCTIGKNVRLEKNVHVASHVVLEGDTVIGSDAKISPFCAIGMEPQHMKYAGEPTKVRIGSGVVLRESVTVHRGTSIGTGLTEIGDNTYLMAYTHIGHDCKIGRNVIMANGCQIAGHVDIGNGANLGGLSAVTQFCRVGAYCFLGGMSIIRKDLPPFLMGKGNEFRVQGINVVGLTRNGFSQDTIHRLKKLYKIFYIQRNTVGEALEKVLTEIGETDEVRIFVDFIQSSKAGFIRGR